MRTFFFFCLMGWYASAAFCNEYELQICIDTNTWYPYTFVAKGNVVSGIHVDVTKKALLNLDIAYTYYAKSWRQCLNDAKEGRADAIVSASYLKEREEFLHYPDDASYAANSKWSIGKVGYVTVHNGKLDQIFYNSIRLLPPPIRVPRGYSIIKNLVSEGRKGDIEEGSNDLSNLRKLVKEQSGVVIMTLQAAKIFLHSPEFKEQLKVSSFEIKAKEYFMVFSKLTPLEKREMFSIWREIAKIRADQPFMSHMFKKY